MKFVRSQRRKPDRRDLIYRICRTARIKHEPMQEMFKRKQLESLALWADNVVQRLRSFRAREEDR